MWGPVVCFKAVKHVHTCNFLLTDVHKKRHRSVFLYANQENFPVIYMLYKYDFDAKGEKMTRKSI